MTPEQLQRAVAGFHIGSLQCAPVIMIRSHLRRLTLSEVHQHLALAGMMAMSYAILSVIYAEDDDE